MNNIFKNAYFGKPYKTRDDKKAIYLRGGFKHHLYLETGGIIDCNQDGTYEGVLGRMENLDIVSEWQEFIICKCQWEDYYDYRIITSDGKGHVRLTFYEDEIWISDLFVDESCRHQGIATMLLNKVDELLEGKQAIITPIENWESEWYNKRGYKVRS